MKSTLASLCMDFFRGTPSSKLLEQRIQRARRIIVDVSRWVIWPKVDLAIRLYLAHALFLSALVKLASWQTAVQLAAAEYPLGNLSSASNAVLGTGVELLGAVCLAVGLLTRYASLGVAVLVGISQSTYRILDAHLFSAALYGWFAVAGAGPISLDALLRRGLAESALPAIARIVRTSEWIRAHGASSYLLMLRLWIGAAALLAGTSLAESSLVVSFVPTGTAHVLPAAAARAVGVMLCAGIGTRLVASVCMVAQRRSQWGRW